jgi:hypothetical protein
MFNVVILLIKSEHVCLKIKQLTVLKMTHNEYIWKTELEDTYFTKTTILQGGHVMVQLVEALCYKPEGRGFDFR